MPVGDDSMHEKTKEEAKGVALDCGGSSAVSRPAASPGSAALARAAQQEPERVSATGEPRRARMPHRRLLAWAANARGAVVRGWGSTSAGVRWTQAGAGSRRCHQRDSVSCP